MTQVHIEIPIVCTVSEKQEKPCLVVRHGNETTKIATFTDDKAVLWFCENFRRFVKLPEDDKE